MLDVAGPTAVGLAAQLAEPHLTPGVHVLMHCKTCRCLEGHRAELAVVFTCRVCYLLLFKRCNNSQ